MRNIPRIYHHFKCRHNALLSNLEEVAIPGHGLKELHNDCPVRITGDTALQKCKEHLSVKGQGIFRIVGFFALVFCDNGRSLAERCPTLAPG